MNNIFLTLILKYYLKLHRYVLTNVSLPDRFDIKFLKFKYRTVKNRM